MDMKLQETPFYLPIRGTAKSVSYDDDNDHYVENHYDYDNNDNNDRDLHTQRHTKIQTTPSFKKKRCIKYF